VPKAYAAIGSVFLLALLLLVNSLAAPVSNLIGWGLPAFLSFKAIESPGVRDDVQWLTYWVVFGFFNFLESFALRAVLYYFPWYFAFKAIFVLWLQLPAFRVSHFSRHWFLCNFCVAVLGIENRMCDARMMPCPEMMHAYLPFIFYWPLQPALLLT
jgi:receptor expression-enhancing protein 5/6